jgi:hypothetical protein
MTVLQQIAQNVLSTSLLPAAACAAQQVVPQFSGLWGSQQQRSMALYTSPEKYHFTFGTNSERGTQQSREWGPLGCPAASSASTDAMLLLLLPADKKERDPTFRKQPKDIAASRSPQRGGSAALRFGRC